MSNSSQSLYFQKQSSISSECGKHALNNFLGKKQYSTSDMEEICYSLSENFINPHKSIFGGEYDVNVMEKAFMLIGFNLEWKKKSQSIEQLVERQDVKGFLINIKLQKKLHHFFLRKSARHWMSIKKGLGGDYLFFNSLEKDAQSLSKKELMFKMKKYEENEELIFPIFTQKKEEDQK